MPNVGEGFKFGLEAKVIDLGLGFKLGLRFQGMSNLKF